MTATEKQLRAENERLRRDNARIRAALVDARAYGAEAWERLQRARNEVRNA